MSKVLTDPPVSSAGTEEPSNAPASAQIEGFEQRVDALSPKARDHWQLTGDLQAAEALDPQESSVTTVSPTEKNKKEKPPVASPKDEGQTASAPGTEEPQPKTPQERNFANLRKERERLDRENLALKAKLEVYERDSAASGKPAPAATDKPPSTELQKPKRPRYAEFQTLDDYEKAMDSYEEKRDQYQAQLLETRERDHSLRQSESQRMSTWTEQVTTAQAKYKDFQAVAFNTDIPASFVAIPRLQARKDGAELAYFLGKHPEEAARIAEISDLPGVHTAEEFRAFLKKAETDPQAARALARVEALADAALDSLSAQLVKPAAPAKTNTRPPAKPTAEVRVEANAKPVEDELAEAIARGDQEAYERIQNRRDIEGRRNGGFSFVR